MIHEHSEANLFRGKKQSQMAAEGLSKIEQGLD